MRINRDRLLQRLEEMGEIGALPGGGCNRQALTHDDKAGRDLFIAWCRTIGCDVSVDRIGNIFARRSGLDPDLAPVLVGSHLDTQPTGGRYDGVYGVLAGLEALTTMAEQGIRTRRSVEVAVWTNEEGARFNPAMLGSGVFAGVFPLDVALATKDKAGVTVAEALHEIGYGGTMACAPRPIHAAFELHIEQGPILEAEGATIGVVTGVQGMRWFDAVLKGTSVHAGPTPMHARRDVFRAVPTILSESYAAAREYGEWARVTFGDVRVHPGVRNTVPDELVLSIDLRHPDEAVLDDMEARFRAAVAAGAAAAGTGASVDEIWRSPAVRFDPACVEIVREAARELGYRSLDIVSGAGHDSVYVARVAPTAMIFIPCTGGISHNPAEDVDPDHVDAGANVLLQTVLRSAA